MHTTLLCVLFEKGEVDEATYGRVLISMGWLSKQHYELTRKTPLLWRAWKRHCKTMMPKQIGDDSVHMKNDRLSLTTRSRCYTADELGFFVPHGGNGSLRCQNMEHFYADTLRVKWPQPRDGTSFNRTRYVDWTLRKYVIKNKRRVAWEEDMERKMRRHRQICDELAQRPWLSARLEGLTADALYLTKDEKESRLEFIDYSRAKRKRKAAEDDDGGGSDGGDD
jgi:hypothetical protein